MSKVNINLIDPIDKQFILLGEKFFPLFRKLGMTANHITLMSYVPAGMAIYFLYHKKFKYAAICYLIQYIIDCWDGHYARTYNMVSKNGDRLDTYKDFFIIFIVFIYIYNHWNFSIYHLLFLILNLSIFILRSNCIDKLHYNNKENKKQFITEKYICVIDDKNTIIKFLNNTKLLGVGVFNIYLTFLIWNLKL